MASLPDRLLYRDGLMLILDKPAGLPVHPEKGGGETLADHLDGLRFGLPRAPELAHRLDRDTSGCLVLGRHRKALARLGELFASGRVDKVYWAVVVGNPAEEEGRIDLALRTVQTARGRRTLADPAGQPAVTTWRVLGRGEGLAWLECRPLTGRTHQIRAHLAAIGHAIAGDRLYGGANAAGALHLHARSVSVPLYPKKPPVEAVAPVPAHMKELLERCGWREEEGP